MLSRGDKTCQEEDDFVEMLTYTKVQEHIALMVIPPFLKRPESRGYAAKANFCFGVMPPRAMLGRS
jgi:hypothetical protein